MIMRRIRHYIFLKDVFLMTISAFGGPQAHLALFFNILVKKRGYITEEELMELNSFCQLLPGPASTQTLTAVGFKIGGPRLAFLTLIIWILPAVSFMTAAAIGVSFLQDQSLAHYTRFIQPMAVGFVVYAAYKMGLLVVSTKTSNALLIISAITCYFIKSPVIFPIILIAGGFITAFRFKEQPEIKQNYPLKIEWSNLILYIVIFVSAALLGSITNALPIRLFENFFRNGSLIFGGGEALSALFYNEFVLFKGYLNNDEFLSGFALQKALPGPLFSFSSYIGAISMKSYGISGAILGGIIGAAGIFLPGTILIFFIIRFWDKLKKYRVVRASFEGINATCAGIVTATAFLLFQPLMQAGITGTINYIMVAGTFGILTFTKIPPPWIIIGGLLAGFLIPVL